MGITRDMTKFTIKYPDLQPFYKQVFENTIADKTISKEIEFARCFVEDWAGNFLHPLGDDLQASGAENSILYCYMASQSVTFDWLCHSLMFGHYQTVLHELRIILENIFYMYAQDVKLKTKTVEEKYKTLKNLEVVGKKPHGKPVFENSGYADWELSYKVYKQLSRYIHIHSETSGRAALDIAKQGYPELNLTEYCKDSFTECSSVWKEIAIIALSLVLDLCEKLGVRIGDLNANYLEKRWQR